MSLKEDKAMMRCHLQDLWSQKNLDVSNEDFPNSFIDLLTSEGVRGREGTREVVSMFLSALPDLHFVLDDLLVEADKVVMRWSMRGTHRGEFQGLPPTGNPVTLTGFTIERFADGQTIAFWPQTSALDLMQQLGVIPQIR